MCFFQLEILQETGSSLRPYLAGAISLPVFIVGDIFRIGSTPNRYLFSFWEKTLCRILILERLGASPRRNVGSFYALVKRGESLRRMVGSVIILQLDLFIKNNPSPSHNISQR